MTEAPIDKTVTISDGSTTLEIPATSWRPTAQNQLTSFSRPKQDGGSTETRALNLNRITTEVSVTAKVTDAFARDNHDGSGKRPALNNKEEWVDELYTLFISGDRLTLEASNTKTVSQTSSFTGYLKAFDWQEEARTDNSTYKVTLKLIEAVALNS